jgi:hypothetical protein
MSAARGSCVGKLKAVPVPKRAGGLHKAFDINILRRLAYRRLSVPFTKGVVKVMALRVSLNTPRRRSMPLLAAVHFSRAV